MLQKTIHIRNYTPEKLQSAAAEVAVLNSYQQAEQVLLLLFVQDWDVDDIHEMTALLGAALPRAEIAGVTHIDQDIFCHEERNAILTFFLFEHPAFQIRRIELSGLSDEAAADALRANLPPETKCAMTLLQRHRRDIGAILKGAGEVPVFGADAALSDHVEGGGMGYVFDGNGVYQQAIILVSFTGEQLQVRLSYRFGWTPVGKAVSVTGVRDPYTVTEIDHRPAAELYETYLGIPYKTNPLSVLNICEFPLTIQAGQLSMGRIPYAWDADGTLKFTAAIREGERLRLSYGFPQQIFAQVYEDAESFRAFQPQAMLLVVCLNRLIFLQESEHLELDAYRAIAPETAYLHGNAEIYRERGAGGEMHSALIAVGFREGPAWENPTKQLPPLERPEGAVQIPLQMRLMHFVRAVTSDLEQTTRELLRLKNHLEDEVEVKTRENESLSLHVVQTLAEAIDAKDTYTNGHSGRVAAYSRAIAQRAGYSERAQNEIFIMGLLHDVGKIGVPDAVINKPGRLTDEEFAQIKTHPVMGDRILQRIKEMPKLATGARWHHERFDGRGYPDGLAGTDIPEEARIIAVADAYDAMTSNRSYRRGMDQSAVRQQIERGRGTQFDPQFADIMLQMIDEDRSFQMREL